MVRSCAPSTANHFIVVAPWNEPHLALRDAGVAIADVVHLVVVGNARMNQRNVAAIDRLRCVHRWATTERLDVEFHIVIPPAMEPEGGEEED